MTPIIHLSFMHLGEHEKRKNKSKRILSLEGFTLKYPHKKRNTSEYHCKVSLPLTE